MLRGGKNLEASLKMFMLQFAGFCVHAGISQEGKRLNDAIVSSFLAAVFVQTKAE